MNKTPLPIEIKNPSHQSLNKVLQNNRPTIDGVNTMDGFTFLKNSYSRDRLLEIDVEYEEITASTPLEIQNKKKEHTFEYDINLSAFADGQLIGIVALEWIPSKFAQSRIWAYEGFVDVQSNYKGKRVGRQLLTHLEQMEEIQNKIVRFGKFTDEGEAVRYHVQNIFTNDNYLILPEESRFNEKLPSQLGWYITSHSN